MEAISYSKRLINKKIIGNDFNEIALHNTKWKFILAPSTKDTTFVLQCMSFTTMDFFNGTLIEVSCDVSYLFDNYGRRPILMDLIIFSENSVEKMNELISADEDLKAFVRDDDPFVILPKMEDIADMISKEMAEAYPFPK